MSSPPGSPRGTAPRQESWPTSGSAPPCCTAEDDTEAERFYQRHAAWNFEEALDTYDGVDADDRASITYLVGELWRRIGDTGRAREWFGRVRDAITNPHEQAWIIRWASQQQTDPREWFA